MTALFAFAIGPIGRYVVASLALIAVVLWLRYDAASEAVTNFSAKVTAAFTRLVVKSDEAQSTVETCRGTWNREAGKCE